MRRRWFLSLFAFLFCLAAGFPLQASPSLSHEQIREAHQKGEIKSLRWVLDQISAQYPGQLLDAELKYKRERYLYEIKLLQQDGYITKLYIDANSAEILRVKSRQVKHRKH